MPGRLQGKVAMVTGSSSGLGRAIAHAYASEGALICCVDRYATTRTLATAEHSKADSWHNRSTDQKPTHELLNHEFGGERAFFVETDVTSAADVERAVESCVGVFGRLDVVVCNAGISVESTHARVTRIAETEEGDWDLTMAVNAKGVFLGCKYAIRQMLKQEPREEERAKGEKADRGWIINTASVQGLVAYYGTPSYCAAKGAVVQLTKQIAVDYASDRIHCNALCPGFLKTNMTQNLQSDPVAYAETNKAHPFGGMGDVEDVARAAVFLASGDAAWVTGVPLVVDGGYTAL